MRPLLKSEAWKLTKEIHIGGEKRTGNYLAKGKVKIDCFERLYLKKIHKSLMEGRNLKTTLIMERRKKTGKRMGITFAD